jgi:three-Cys-motif partner protein
MAAKLEFDKIGYWSVLKLEILKKYASAYTTIMRAQKNPSYHYSYIDAFAGAGTHLLKRTGEPVPGSPLNALAVNPPFSHFHFIDLDGSKATNLRKKIGNRSDVDIYHGDCNTILLEKIFPNIRYEDYRRALCILDPYGLHLNWKVIEQAGSMKTIEIFLNFPVADMNRNVLWHDPSRVASGHATRMTAFWGDDSWSSVAYVPSKQKKLFGGDEPDLLKAENDTVAEAFRQRLRKVAGFTYVPQPIPMRNSTNATVYYLFFASRNATAGTIVEKIFETYRNRRN